MTKSNTTFTIKSYLKLSSFQKEQKKSTFPNVWISVLKTTAIQVILLVDKAKKMSNVSDYLENNPFTLKILRFYSIPKKNFKYMEKISKKYIHLKAKLPTLFIISKEWTNLGDCLSLIENLLWFTWKSPPSLCHSLTLSFRCNLTHRIL